MTSASKAASLFFFLLFGAAAATAAPTKPAPVESGANAVSLVPHRAIYKLELVKMRHGRFAQGLNGWILYDFAGNACDGYVQHFRQISELDAGDGMGSVNDLSATTWESGTATSFRFNSQNLLDKKPVESVDGHAVRDDSGAAVNLSKPSQKNFQIGAGIVFPTEQMRRIIASARAGEAILPLPVYDGSENGEKIFNTLTVIGHPIAPGTQLPADAAAGQAPLAKLTRWPVSISYFDRAAKPGDEQPDYTISFELYENGISRALVLDYNDYVISGDMVALKIGDAKPCH